MLHRDAKIETWHSFLADTEHKRCWWCGLGHDAYLEGFYKELILERSHVVNKPRILDRRVATISCSRCHMVEHGYSLRDDLMVPKPTLGNLLWIKKRFDPEYHDRDFMQRFSVSILPRAQMPPRNVEDLYTSNSGRSWPK